MKSFSVKKILFSILVALGIVAAHGCSTPNNSNDNDSFFFKPRSINDFIERQKQKPAEIIELVCDPGADAIIKSKDYDKLSQLTSLESITFKAIGSAEDAQNFFSQLVDLPNLKTVRIEDSRIGSISKLAEIKNLQELHIVLGTYGSPSCRISDLDKLGEKGCFTDLKILELRNMQVETMPDMSELKNLEELSISGYDLKQLDYNCFSWSGLTSLDLSATGISELDSRIVNDLQKLKKLDLSWSSIKDASFVLDLPQLEEFTFRMHTKKGTDLEILKKHPNFNDSWMRD